MRDWCSFCQFETYYGDEEPCINCVKTYNEKPSEFTPATDEVRGVGKWIQVIEEDGTCSKCSCCGEGYYIRFLPPFYYCPNCGAKMEVSEDG